jgi:signal transduction histidine kinase
MRPWRFLTRSFYGRIAGLYLVLLLGLCLVCVWVALHAFSLVMMQLDQRASRNVAKVLAMRLEPALQAGRNRATIQAVARRIERVNPSFELYVLNARGRVIASSESLDTLRHKRVALAPIKRFLGGAALPVQGEDPNAAERKIFSAAPVTIDGGRRGYVYVILHDEPYLNPANMIQSSYFLHAMVVELLLTLVFTGLIGLVLFALLTRRFRALAAAVERFKNGRYTERAPDHKPDEIGRLGTAFNEMAATIVGQVEALQRTEEARRTLVANLSHDLRTPLTSLRGYVERMLNKAGTLTPEERHECLHAVLGDATLLSQIAEQLSVLSRLDVPRRAPALESFSIAELGQDVIVKFRPQAEARGVTLDVNASRDLPEVMADIALIERALSNLIDNALANTPAGGRVDLDLRREGGGVRIGVTDTGWGIPADELPLVKQRFYRSRRSRAEGLEKGSGLGLAIVNEIVEKHGAALEMQSQVGRGTTVSFVLDSSENETEM